MRVASPVLVGFSQQRRLGREPVHLLLRLHLVVAQEVDEDHGGCHPAAQLLHLVSRRQRE